MATTKKATRRAASKKTTKGAAPKRKDAASKSSPAKSPVTAQSPVKRFRAVVNRREGGEVCSIDIPFDVEKTFGARGRVPVRGTINGAPFRSSIFRMGGDCHFMVVNRQMREAAGVRGGETVPVTLERDTEARTVTPPADFARALKANKDAQATWNKLSYTHQREHVEAIEGAKKSETRLRRIEKSVELLAAGKKPRG
ncbi:MAG: YdeI/OmpD-associated family protein [Acidobacteriota bacterium]|nr:YdeI/OmpD-associated family protein [Acidobacteriota bacterium]MDQ5836163.1 YdeI/OmpD-associated family protein [Acidobacteriota bacterium]